LDGFVRNFANVDVLRDAYPFLRIGFINTIKLVGASFVLAVLVGALLVWMRTRESAWLRKTAIAYIDLARALPPLVVLMLVYYVLPTAGLPTMTVFQAAVLTFGAIQGAFVGEIFRGAVLAVERGQLEAARSIGLSWSTTARRVVVPQMFGVVIPPLTNQATQLVRDSALAFFIGYPELLTSARAATNFTANSTPLLAAAVLYAVLMLTVQLIAVLLERRVYSQASR
jgi:polar amino acid transport system permease protein